MNEQEKFWLGGFGDEYTQRNQVKWRERVPFWKRVIAIAEPTMAYEIGCNAGWNLRALRETSPGMSLGGIDVNTQAASLARAAGFDVVRATLKEMNLEFRFPADLVFTAGVLIHIPPDQLAESMQKIVSLSARWVMAVEYEADEETEVEYRGHAARLWKRPFGRLYMDMGLKLLAKFENPEGFDRCTAWLMEKP